VEVVEECTVVEELMEAPTMVGVLMEGHTMVELEQAQPVVALQLAVETLAVEHVTRKMPACPMWGVAEDPTLHRQSTNMLEPAVVKWSMLHHLHALTASASYPSALSCACSHFFSGGSWDPAQP